MNNKNKRFKMHRTVIFEKFSKKNSILASHAYLRRLGICLFIELREEYEPGKGITKSHVDIVDEENRKLIFATYDESSLFHLFYTFATNPKLKNVKHNPIVSGETPKFHGVINHRDKHHSTYRNHHIKNKKGEDKQFLLYFKTWHAMNQAGFEDYNNRSYKRF